jgi:hypothetical protein
MDVARVPKPCTALDILLGKVNMNNNIFKSILSTIFSLLFLFVFHLLTEFHAVWACFQEQAHEAFALIFTFQSNNDQRRQDCQKLVVEGPRHSVKTWSG